MIYFDNNATTHISPGALEEFRRVSALHLGNSESLHCCGKIAFDLLETVRSDMMKSLKLSNDFELIFTSGGSESNTLCLFGSVRHRDNKIEQVVISALEHDSVYGLSEFDLGVPALVCPATREGVPDLGFLQEVSRKKRSLISCMHVNNETGIIFPVEEIAGIAQQNDAVLHVDMVQSFAKTDVSDLCNVIDALSFSGHKFHGPIGVGGVIKKKRLQLQPDRPGGMQEGGVRSGTVNVPAVAAMGVAFVEACRCVDKFNGLKILRTKLERFFKENYPQSIIVGEKAERIANTLNICFPGIANDDLIAELSRMQICAGKGSACSSRKLTRSRVLEAMQIDDLYALGSIRVSFSRFQTYAEIEKFMHYFGEAYNRALQNSPYF